MLVYGLIIPKYLRQTIKVRILTIQIFRAALYIGHYCYGLNTHCKSAPNSQCLMSSQTILQSNEKLVLAVLT